MTRFVFDTNVVVSALVFDDLVPGRQQLTQQFVGHVKLLEERYARPLPALEQAVEAFSAKVEGHLKRMELSL